MRFYFGLVREEGFRYVVAGDATPTLKDVTELASSDILSEGCDWGPAARVEVMYGLACRLLADAGPDLTCLPVDGHALAVAFVEQILAKLETDKKWLLSAEDIRVWTQKWLQNNSKVTVH